jgi:uncharacterized protein YnzC (UPF0291/DUF896 family)
MGKKVYFRAAFAALVAFGAVSTALATLETRVRSNDLLEKALAESLTEKDLDQQAYRKHIPVQEQKVRRALSRIAVEIGDELGTSARPVKMKLPNSRVKAATSNESVRKELDQEWKQINSGLEPVRN